jgi:hypothetical protein
LLQGQKPWEIACGCDRAGQSFSLPNHASSGMLLLGAAEDAPVPLTNACQRALCAIDLHFYWQEVTTSSRETFVIGA